MQNDGGTRLTSHLSSPDVIAGQIVYKVNRLYSKTLIGGTYTLGFTDSNYNYSTQDVPDFDSERIVDNECVNIYARWCGDGIPDATHNEQCDLGAQNGQPGSTCSATCQTVTTVACVPGPTTGPQPAPLTATSSGLCL